MNSNFKLPTRYKIHQGHIGLKTPADQSTNQQTVNKTFQNNRNTCGDYKKPILLDLRKINSKQQYL